MATIVKIINEMIAGDIDSYNIFKDKVMNYIDSHYPDISHNDYDDIIENIIEKIIENNEGLKSKNNPYQYIHRLINSNIKKYNKELETENEIVRLNEDIYYSEDLIIDQICKTELIIQIYNVLNTLTERHRTVLKYRFFGPYSLEETGQRFVLSREQIRQLESKALRELRRPIRSKKLKDFLDDDDGIINNIYGQSISRDYYIDYLGFNVNDTYNYYLDKLNSDLKIEETRFTRTQEEIEYYRKEMARKEKLAKERERKKAEKLKNENYEEERRKKKEIEERKKKAEAYINYLNEKEKRKETKKDKRKQIIDNHYNMLIVDYVSRLKQTADLIYEVMLNTEGDKRELCSIVTNFNEISFEEYKQNIMEFYRKHYKVYRKHEFKRL